MKLKPLSSREKSCRLSGLQSAVILFLYMKMSDKVIKYEAQHAVNYHCPAETPEEFELWIRSAREEWTYKQEEWNTEKIENEDD